MYIKTEGKICFSIDNYKYIFCQIMKKKKIMISETRQDKMTLSFAFI